MIGPLLFCSLVQCLRCSTDADSSGGCSLDISYQGLSGLNAPFKMVPILHIDIIAFKGLAHFQSLTSFLTSGTTRNVTTGEI